MPANQLLAYVSRNTACSSRLTEARQGADGGGGSHQVALDLELAEGVGLVGSTLGRRLAVRHTGAARVGHDGGVDGDDVGHGEKGGEAGADLGEKVRALALPLL